ncbi:MAG: hypothetical protein E6J41_07680 [Chloroflexi bacterium]|nr:MAG: hypothetical protein E6J41_07680 [Chloroflexota bacterium]
MRRRIIAFAAAVVGSALIATGFGVAVDAATRVGASRPHLRTVPDAALARAGYSLAPPGVPPHCWIAQQAVGDRLPRGLAGCPISRQAAIADATRGSDSRALDAVLARASGVGDGFDRVAWLVVVRSSIVMTPAIACTGSSSAVSVRCTVPIGGTTLQLLDAYSGRVLRFLVMGPSGLLRSPGATFAEGQAA